MIAARSRAVLASCLGAPVGKKTLCARECAQDETAPAFPRSPSCPPRAAARAAELPYDKNANARADVKKALAAAAASHQSVLVVFGANWCPDCRVLSNAFKHGPSAPLVAKDFQVVKVDVGELDKNVDLAKSYGISLDKGIPAVAVLSANGKVLHATRDSELADARHMGDDGIYQFFAKMTGAKPAA